MATNRPPPADFPSLMSDDEINDAAQSRRLEPNDPYRRKDKPDPWPIVEQQFPRIAAAIRELWGKRALDEYFAKLVVVERGEREGFPPDVLAAILEIAWLHGQRLGAGRLRCPWDADVRQSKWWDRG